MKSCTPLWREADFEKVQKTSASDYWGGPFQWLQFCDKFQLPFLELLFGHFRIQNKNIKST